MMTALHSFRKIAITEAISYLVLLFIAMPLKYFANLPQAVKYVGWLHGILFILYVIYLLRASQERQWKLSKVFLLFLASLVPFAPFIVDKQLKKEE